jgi:hypothetical protein
MSSRILRLRRTSNVALVVAALVTIWLVQGSTFIAATVPYPYDVDYARTNSRAFRGLAKTTMKQRR